MADPDYSSWLLKQDAADRIGVSTKTLEKLAADRKIEQARWRPGGRGNEFVVYNPDDVARIAAERRPAPAPFVLPAVPPGNGNGHGLIGRPAPNAEAPQAVAAGLAALAAALQSFAPNREKNLENLENLEKRFLTLPEAAAVSGLSVGFLRRARAAGTLPAERDRWRDAEGRWHVGWKIRRKDLEAL